MKNAVIVFFSLIFYGWQEGKYLLLMSIVIVLGYFYGILLEIIQKESIKKVLLFFSVSSFLMILAYFKYMNFFLENVVKIFSLNFSIEKILLPVGISFYIFQILSYNIDVYRGTTKAQRNIITVAAYISMFPQLVAGPIVRYKDIEKQLIKREHSFAKAYMGIKRFIQGFAKKILLANQLGEVCDLFRERGEESILFFWIYAIAFLFHIYFDFSGYSDMAIGLAKMMGFELIENFNYPYVSRSITEFWRRWHISLGSWFRDYVYIPMGGNRVSFIRWIFNIAIVWFLTGFWHGASWNFIIWGLYFAIFLIIEKLGFNKILEKSKVGTHCYVLFVIIISFLIFDARTLKEAFTHIGGLFGVGCNQWMGPESVYYLKNYFVVFLLGSGIVTSRGKKYCKYILIKLLGQNNFIWGELGGIIVLLLVSTAYLVDGSFNPFLYFRF